jgi:hypothetical protein
VRKILADPPEALAAARRRRGGETAAEARKRVRGLRAEGSIAAEARRTARPESRRLSPGDALGVLRALAGRERRFTSSSSPTFSSIAKTPSLVLEAGGKSAPGAVTSSRFPTRRRRRWSGTRSRAFDPVGAGPEDAGHLRWFTRRSLRELLEESGFPVVSLEGSPLPRDTGLAGRIARAGIAFDAGELAAIQWIATAVRAGEA